MDKKILVIEDNDMDVSLLKKAFELNCVSVIIEVILNGEDAIARIGTINPPNIIILDLNLPIKDGRTVLVELKKHETWKKIPVIVMTSSLIIEDICEVYDTHANCYLKKPISFKDFKLLAKLINDFWLESVVLPRCEVDYDTN